jgi:hypothetical protein
MLKTFLKRVQPRGGVLDRFFINFQCTSFCTAGS